jgi:hypothetical protein
MAVGEIIIADTMTTQGSYVLQQVSLRKIKYIVHHKYMSVSFLDVYLVYNILMLFVLGCAQFAHPYNFVSVIPEEVILFTCLSFMTFNIFLLQS